MARERLIKAKFFRSEDIAVLPFEGRLLFQSMWCHADRMGTLKYSPRLLKADTFPFDDVTAQQIQDLVSLMERHGMVKTFTHDGVDYLRVVSFSKYQKPHPREPQSWPFLTDSGEVTAKPEPVNDKPRQSRNKKPSGKAFPSFPSLSSSPSLSSLRKEDSFATSDGSAKPLLTFPCSGEPKSFDFTQSMLDHWQSLYSDLDVWAETQKAYAWVDANTKKTAGGMKKFLNGWYSRATNNGGVRRDRYSTSSQKQSGSHEATEHELDEIAKVLGWESANV